METAVVIKAFQRSVGGAEHLADGRARAARAAFVYDRDHALFRHDGATPPKRAL